MSTEPGRYRPRASSEPTPGVCEGTVPLDALDRNSSSAGVAPKRRTRGRSAPPVSARDGDRYQDASRQSEREHRRRQHQEAASQSDSFPRRPKLDGHPTGEGRGRARTPARMFIDSLHHRKGRGRDDLLVVVVVAPPPEQLCEESPHDRCSFLVSLLPPIGGQGRVSGIFDRTQLLSSAVGLRRRRILRARDRSRFESRQTRPPSHVRMDDRAAVRRPRRSDASSNQPRTDTAWHASAVSASAPITPPRRRGEG